MKTLNKRNKGKVSRELIKTIILAKRIKEKVNLEGANLEGAYNLYVFNAFDTSKRMVYCVRHSDTWYIKAGCFWGTIAELKAKVLATHNSKVYLHNIALLEQL